MMSWVPHKGLELDWLAMIDIFANFFTQVLNKIREDPWKFGCLEILILFNT